MKISFKDKNFKKGDTLETGSNPVSVTPWYLKIFGFKYQYAIFVLGNLIQVEDHFYYNVKLKNKELKWIWKEKLLTLLNMI